MRLKSKSQLQAIKKSSTLPEAIGSKDGSVMFRVYIDVDATIAVKNNILFLDYEVMPADVEKVTMPKLSAANSAGIYQVAALRSEKLKRDKDLVVYSGRSDITKYLPNDRLREIKAGAQLKKLTTVRLSNSQNSIRPPTVRSGASANVVPNSAIAKSSYKTIAEYKKKDPADELNSKPFHAPLSKSVSGIRTTGNYSNADLHFEVARSEMQKSGNTFSSIERAEQAITFVTVPIDVYIPNDRVGSYNVVVKAIKGSVSAQRIDQIVDFSSLLKEAMVPSIAPKISVIDNGTKRKIGVKQLDPRAAGIRIYRKSLNKDVATEDSYELIANLNASSGDTFNIPDTMTSAQSGIYRAVSYDASGKTIGEFSSSTIAKSKLSKQKNVEDPVTIFAYETSNGIQVAVHNIPYGVIATRIVRRNLTTREKEFIVPASVDGSNQKALDKETSSTSFFDKPLRPDTAFEYKVALIDIRGNVYESQRSTVVHYVGSKSIEESKSLISQDYRIESDGSGKTVTFQIDVSSSKTTLDQVYELLVSTGLSSQYLNEIKSNRELLNKLTALEIVRFDCVTGQVENFGVVNSGVFEDSSRTRSVYNVSDIVPGRKYIYFARLLVRSPSTIFSQTNLNRVDVETGRHFDTNLKKYNSPKSLRKGMLSSNVVQKRAVSATGISDDPSSSTSDEMIAGATSTTVAVIVEIPRKDAELGEVFVRKIQRGNEISWTLLPNDRKIDHVIVHADYNGVLAPLRAVHFDGNTKMMFIDEALASESTPVNYYVQVVYSNYDMGPTLGPARSR